MTHSTRFATTAALLALTGVLLSTPASAAPTIAISGQPGAAPGSSFQLSVAASDVADLYAYQFDVQFDPALFRAIGATAGSFLSTAGSTFFDGGMVDNTAGTISFIFESLIGPGPGASGAGELLQLHFEAVEQGSGQGVFSLVNAQALDSSLNAMDVSLVGTAVAVPEPSSLAMWALALAAFGAGGRGTRLSTWLRRRA